MTKAEKQHLLISNQKGELKKKKKKKRNIDYSSVTKPSTSNSASITHLSFTRKPFSGSLNLVSDMNSRKPQAAEPNRLVPEREQIEKLKNYLL